MRPEGKKGRLIVIGSFNADFSVYTSVFPRDGETVGGNSAEMSAGGKGSNQATAAHRAGGDVTLVTKVGSDFLSKLAFDHYSAEGMDTKYVYISESSPTGAALIEVNSVSGENRIIIVSGANTTFTHDEINSAADAIRSSSVLLLQYEINRDALISAKRIAKQNGVAVVVNPAPYMEMSDEFMADIDCITPNETEAEYLTGIKTDTDIGVISAAKKLHSMGIHNVVITLGKRGAYYSGDDGEMFIESIPTEAVDTTGAGDSFNGAMCVSIAEDMANGRRPDYLRAVRIGNCTGSLSVRKKGASVAMPYRDEIMKLYDKTYKK